MKYTVIKEHILFILYLTLPDIIIPTITLITGLLKHVYQHRNEKELETYC